MMLFLCIRDIYFWGDYGSLIENLYNMGLRIGKYKIWKIYHMCTIITKTSL